jgi:hypothetical protein
MHLPSAKMRKWINHPLQQKMPSPLAYKSHFSTASEIDVKSGEERVMVSLFTFS